MWEEIRKPAYPSENHGLILNARLSSLELCGATKEREREGPLSRSVSENRETRRCLETQSQVSREEPVWEAKGWGNGWEGPAGQGDLQQKGLLGTEVRHEGMGDGAHESPGVWTSENPRGVLLVSERWPQTLPEANEILKDRRVLAIPRERKGSPLPHLLPNAAVRDVPLHTRVSGPCRASQMESTGGSV